jgi:hypothetical protein
VRRFFPIASALLAAVEACMDPWDATAWVEMSTDDKDPDAAEHPASLMHEHSTTEDVKRELAQYLAETEQKHAAHVLTLHAAQEKHKALYDPHVHTGSAEVINALTQSVEDMHLCVHKAKQLVRLLAAHRTPTRVRVVCGLPSIRSLHRACACRWTRSSSTWRRTPFRRSSRLPTWNQMSRMRRPRRRRTSKPHGTASNATRRCARVSCLEIHHFLWCPLVLPQ